MSQFRILLKKKLGNVTEDQVNHYLDHFLNHYLKEEPTQEHQSKKPDNPFLQQQQMILEEEEET